MKTIFGYDTQEVRDFGVIVSDRVYNVIRNFLVVHQMKYPKDVEFISDVQYDRKKEE